MSVLTALRPVSEPAEPPAARRSRRGEPVWELAEQYPSPMPAANGLTPAERLALADYLLAP